MLYLRRMLVSECMQTLEQRFTWKMFSEAQGKCGTRKFCRTQPSLRRRPDVRKHDDGLMTQEAGEDIHALCRALQPLRRTMRGEVHAVQFRQLVDIRLRQQRLQIFPPRAQRLASTRQDSERPRAAVISGGSCSVLHGAGKAVCKNLLRRSIQRF